MSELIAISPEALQSLCERYQVRRMLLFGSALGEDFGPESDVDLLVEYDPRARVSLLDMAALRRELSSILGRQVDLGTPESLSPYLRDRVLASAQVIYERA
jgi:uncharacterized protein